MSTTSGNVFHSGQDRDDRHEPKDADLSGEMIVTRPRKRQQRSDLDRNVNSTGELKFHQGVHSL